MNNELQAYQLSSCDSDSPDRDAFVPPLPPSRCIEWSLGERLSIAGTFGDFSSLVDAKDNQATVCRTLEFILGDPCLQSIREHLLPFVEAGVQPCEFEIEIELSGGKQYVRLESVFSYRDDDSLRVFSYWQDITELKHSQRQVELLTQVVDSIPSWIFLKNTDHDYEMVNSSYAAFYGTTPDKCVGKNSVDLGVPHELAAGCKEKGILGFWDVDDEVFATGRSKEVLSEPIVVGEETCYLQTLKTPITDPHSGRQLLVGFCHDITYLKKVETRIGIELRHNKTLNRVGDLLRSFETFDAAAQQSVCAVLLESLRSSVVCIHLEGSSPAQAIATDPMNEPKQCTYEVPIDFRGSVFGKLQVVFNHDSEFQDQHIEQLLLEVAKKLAVHTHGQHLIAEINFRANHDALTDLPNRLLFSKEIEIALASADQKENRFAVILIDLDGFKQVNDSMGHPCGDKLLLAVAERLRETALPNEALARLGGDEFAVLVKDIDDLADASLTAERYLKAIRRPYDMDGRILRIGASLGISCFSNECSSITALLQDADSAMYYAKENGRNSCQPFDKSLAEKTNHRMELQHSLLRAIARDSDELFLMYQPKFDLSTNRAVGVEVLARWNHPKFGLVSPSEFIPLAEESGLILQLGDCIRKRAFKTVAQWNRRLEMPIPLSLNITPPELEQHDMTDRLLETLKESQLAPNCLDLELTETFMMNEFEKVSERLSKLREQGVTISIDDFGSGYSCMSYLHRLPVDFLKIDRSFVKLLDFPVGDLKLKQVAIPQAIMTMARSFGLKTVAEGIETQNQLDHVVKMGADLGQGFFLCRPLLESDAFDLFSGQQKPV